MSKHTRIIFFSSPIIVVVLATALSFGTFQRMMAFKAERYETGSGDFKGAASCKECHEEIYNQWKSSLHAGSTKDPYMHTVLERIPYFPNKLMMGEPCYSCHGPKKLDEGVSCEVCHGISDREDIMEVHSEKYTPNLEDMRKPEFCGKCHEAIHPLTTDVIITTMQEWEASRAGKEGTGCIDCHMKRNDGAPAFHGAASRRRDASVYGDDVVLKNFTYHHPFLSLDIENKITGHYLPTGGPEPTLLLVIDLQKNTGESIFSFKEAFQRNSTPSMAFPGNVLSDNRLRDGETRTLRFTVPESCKGQFSTVKTSLKFLDIDFIHEGDVKKARWQSAAFYERSFSLTD